MENERLPARFSLRSQLWSRWKGNGYKTATSHMQTVVPGGPTGLSHLKEAQHVEQVGATELIDPEGVAACCSCQGLLYSRPAVRRVAAGVAVLSLPNLTLNQCRSYLTGST